MKKIIRNSKEFYDTNPKAFKALLLFCFFLSFLLASPILNFILESKPRIQDFSSHVISNASLRNFDVSKRIKLYYSGLLSVLILTAVLFLISFNRFKKRAGDFQNHKKELTLISNLSLIGIACIFSSFFLINVDLAVLFIVFLVWYLLLSITQNKFQWHKNNGFWILIISIPFSVLLHQTIKSVLASRLSALDNIQLQNAIETLIFFLPFFAICIFLHQFLKWFFENAVEVEQKRQQLFFATIPISFVLIFQSIFLEFFNIFNVRIGFVFKNPKLLFTGFAILAILFSVLIYKRIVKLGRHFDKNILVKYHFVLLIIAVGFMTSQPWSMISPENEFFEAGNHGISIDHFFRYGSIPIIENFDAHMLSNQLFPFLYGILNGYEPWAPLLYISYIIIFNYLIVYQLLKRIMGSEYALVICLCFPLLGLVNNYYVFVGTIGLLLISTLNSSSKNKFYWFWAGTILLCIYRLDIGFSSLISGALAYLLMSYILKKSVEFKKFALAGIITFVSALLLFVFLCVLKSINPINRLHEFLLVAMSNQNWAFTDMGDMNHIVFRISYYVLPLLIVFLLAKVILKSFLEKEYVIQILKTKQTQAAFILFVYFAFNFYFNIPRGIVRHTFISGITTNIISTIPLALLAFIFIKKRKENILIFLSASFGLYLVVNLNKPTFKDAGKSFFSEAVLSPSFSEKFNGGAAFNGTRVRESFSLSEIRQFKGILDAVLEPDETYFDFASLNLYHVLVGRKNPTYVNQSPLLLNGDDSQKMAIEEIKNSKAPIVIVPKGENIWKMIDGVPTNYKYYMISEYIYKNYTPFLAMSNFDIYVLKSKKIAFKNKLKKNAHGSAAFSTQNFSAVNLEKLIQNDIIVEKTFDKKILLKKNGTDPFIFGLIEQFDKLASFNKDIPVSIKIKVATKTAGSVQIFYLKQEENSFVEENSKRFSIDTAGEHDLVLALNSFPKDLRIDLDISELVVEEISFVSAISDTGKEKMDIEIPTFDLGSIPLVWGKKSEKDLFDKMKKLNDEVIQTSFVIETKEIKYRAQPFYLFVEMKSETKQVLKVEMFNERNEKKGEYFMNAPKSIGQRLALRVSTNYYWWNEHISKIVLTSETIINVSKLGLIAADGSEQVSYKDSGFLLCNINDDFWFNGVGKQANILLFANSPQILKVLRSSKQIQLIDGSKITIKNITEAGNYIHVEIEENLEAYKLAASYPNEIKFVK